MSKQAEDDCIDEVDALTLEKFDLQLQLLQSQAQTLSTQRDAFGQHLIAKHALNATTDKIDLPTRKIIRG